MSSDNTSDLSKVKTRPTYYEAEDYLEFSDEESDPIEHSDTPKPDPSLKQSLKESPTTDTPVVLDYDFDHNAFFSQPHEKSQDLWWDYKGNTPKEENKEEDKDVSYFDQETGEVVFDHYPSYFDNLPEETQRLYQEPWVVPPRTTPSPRYVFANLMNNKGTYNYKTVFSSGTTRHGARSDHHGSGGSASGGSSAKNTRTLGIFGDTYNIAIPQRRARDIPGYASPGFASDSYLVQPARNPYYHPDGGPTERIQDLGPDAFQGPGEGNARDHTPAQVSGYQPRQLCRHSFLPKTIYELEVALFINHVPTLDRIEFFRFATPRLKREKRDRLICHLC